jgi:hypothetical protein
VAYNLAPVFKQRFTDSNGNPLSGGKLYTYQAGTTTPQATYVAAGGAANDNPVILDASGECNLWLDPSLSYKFTLKDSSDVTQWTVDSVIGTLVNDAVSTSALQDRAVTGIKIALATIERENLAVGAIGRSSQPTTRTSNYTIQSTDDTVFVDGSGGAFTVTLPTAVGIQGRKFKVVRVDDTVAEANQITIGTTSSQTINGASSKKICSQWEMFEFESNNANWIITSRYISPVETDRGAVPLTATTSNPTKGTMSIDKIWEQRVGEFAEYRIEMRYTAAGTGGTGDYLFGLPSGRTIKASRITAYSTVEGTGGWTATNSVGGGQIDYQGTSVSMARVVVYNSTNVRLFLIGNTAGSVTAGVVNSADYGIVGTSGSYCFNFRVPIAGWEG